MTDKLEIVNRALQAIGTRTTVTQTELDNEDSNEAKQANLAFDNCRNDLFRMAPWNCALKAENMVYITSTPGTPENQSPGTNLWQPGQPMPPWAYEYQYPVDCLRPCWIIPALQTGFAGGIPIYPVATAMSSYSYGGAPPVKYIVMTDDFRPVTAAAVVSGGTGYAVGDKITLPYGAVTDVPIGAPVKLEVATLGVGTAIATVNVVTQIMDEENPPAGGSYFSNQAGTIAQDTTDGSGTGATFTLTQGAKSPQRVILTNQEQATLAYIRLVEDINVWDTLFQTAIINILGATICMSLSGDKDLANKLVGVANGSITTARTADGNEGLTVNDVTPDWIRIRGIYPIGAYNGLGPNAWFDWGPLWPTW